MEVFLFDDTGRYLGPKQCQKNPLSEGLFLKPVMSTDTPPCEVDQDHYPHWNGESWEPRKLESAMTDAEKIEAGLRTLSPYETLDGDSIRQKTIEELVNSGVVTHDQHVEIIKAQRKAAYFEEADPLYLDEVYKARKSGAELNLDAWVAKKDEIKARFPKP